jgi:hypothetical protein
MDSFQRRNEDEDSAWHQDLDRSPGRALVIRTGQKHPHHSQWMTTHSQHWDQQNEARSTMAIDLVTGMVVETVSRRP